MFSQTGTTGMPTNIDVLSRSGGSEIESKMESAFKSAGVHEDFINQCTIVLNNKAHRVKEFL